MIIPKEKVLEAVQKFGERAAFIIAEDLNLQEFDEKNLKSLCYFHKEETPSFVWNNRDHNFFKCFSCGKVYSIVDHYMSFYGMTYLEAIEKLFSETGIQHRFGEKGVKTSRDYRYPKYDCTEDRSKVEKYLEKRNISKETLDYSDVQQDKNGNIVFNFYDTNDVLTLVKYRPAREIKKGENKSWCQVDADSRPILYNMNKIDPNKPLLVTEGEVDTLSVIESGYKNVVSIPLGSQNTKWIEENYDWLEQFERIIIWSDNDAPGLAMRKEVCSRLGVWRTLFVDLPNIMVKPDGTKVRVKDANDVLSNFGTDKVIELIENAQEIPLAGVDDLANVPEFDIETEPGLKTNLLPIDDTLYKFLFGSVVIVTGMRGAGKSTLINQCFVCEPLRQNHDVFVFSGELSPPVLKSWIELTMAGPEKVTMKDKFIHIIDSAAKKAMRSWYAQRIWVYKEKSNKFTDVIEKAVAVTRKYGAKVWILDNLTTLDLGANDSNLLEKQKELIVELNRLAQLYGVLIVLVIHPRKVMAGQELNSDDVAGSGSLTNLAQYVMSVKRYSKREKEGEMGRSGYKKGKEPIREDVEINIMKNRFTGKTDIVRLFFNYKSYRFFSRMGELIYRYPWNEDKSAYPEQREERLRLQETPYGDD